MKNISSLLFLFCFLTQQIFAGLPPTTSKVSGDSSDLTTFKYQFPNFTGTHTGTTISLGVNGVAGGGTAVTSVTTSPTASSFAGWDANSNLSAASFIPGYATTATGASTTTLTVASKFQQYFTGTTTQTVVLPVTSTLVLGQPYLITNSSTGVVTVQSSGANTILAQAAGTTALYTTILTSGTTAASWNSVYLGNGGAVTPTVTRYTSSSGTYTTPANVIYLEIEMVGSGGGGGSSGTSGGSNNNGAAGSVTTFSVHSGSAIVTAGAGAAGAGGGNSASGGAGGTNTFNSPSVKIIDAGGGYGSGNGINAPTTSQAGGAGGSTCYGGEGGATTAAADGNAGVVNTGGGGAGASSGTAGYAGLGGGGGGCVRFLLLAPSASYDYSVGASAAGGVTNSSGHTGGASGSGLIKITEYYSNGPVGSATSITGGSGGSIPYQSAASTTAMLANGSANQVVMSQGGTSAPIFGLGKPSGEVFMTAATSCPTGSLAANGASLLRSGDTTCTAGPGTCNALFTAISTTYGTADGTHFTLPDMRGVFPRGAGSQTINTRTYTGTQGTTQEDQFQGHQHSTITYTAGSATTRVQIGSNTSTADSFTTGNIVTDGTNGTPRFGTQTYPSNITLMYCIAY